MSGWIVALVGPLGAGKDTVAKHLVEKRGFRRFAFADAIKREYYAASGHSEDEFKASRGTPLETEIREGLWHHSDQVKRERGSLYFINLVVGAMLDCPSPAVVTDIRTREELDAMRQAGAKVVLVLRTDADPHVLGNTVGFRDNTPIPGARLSYKDLRWDDKLFLNRECADPASLDCVIGRFCEESGIVVDQDND